MLVGLEEELCPQHVSRLKGQKPLSLLLAVGDGPRECFGVLGGELGNFSAAVLQHIVGKVQETQLALERCCVID